MTFTDSILEEFDKKYNGKGFYNLESFLRSTILKTAEATIEATKVEKRERTTIQGLAEQGWNAAIYQQDQKAKDWLKFLK